MNTAQQTFSLEIQKDEEKSHAEITGTVPREKIEEVRTSVLERLQKQKKIDGFRDGTAPLDIVERTVGSLEVWRQSTHEVIMRHFPEIVAEEGLAPLGSPNLQLTSMPVNGDVAFRISFFTMPKVTLPDYAAIVRAMDDPKAPEPATDEEVQQIVNDVRRSLYKKAHPEKQPPTDEKDLPELTDEYIQEISQQYKDRESFLKGVRESITAEKKMQARAMFRESMLDAIIAKTAITIPDVVVEEDSKRAYTDLEKQAERLGTTIAQYLKEQNINEEQLRGQLKEESKKRAHLQLVMNAISAKEHIHPDSKDVEKEVARFRDRAGDMTDEQVHTYIESILTNEAVMQFLEKQQGKEHDAQGNPPQNTASG